MIDAADAATAADHELTLVRVIDAPRERVFAAWTDPEQLAAWWDPHGFATSVDEMDLRSGGAFRTVMRAPDGTEYPNAGVFLEVVAPERIVFTDAYGEGRRPSAMPFTAAVVTFEEQGGRTKVTSRALHWSAADREARAISLRGGR